MGRWVGKDLTASGHGLCEGSTLVFIWRKLSVKVADNPAEM